LVEGAADEKMEKMEKMARLLLDAGADTRRRNDEGRTPLETAIAFNHPGMISLLAIASS
jgi:ankyrin repeat protein